jgi:AcrR family transcriptional regulator
LARNKYPEQTRQKILEVAKGLFLEKGYDDTSIQDIVDGLGGMTKGTIYHHFKSKTDIFEHIIQDIGGEFTEEIFHNGETAFEKLQNAILRELKAYDKIKILTSAKILLNSPRMIGESYIETFSVGTPAIKTLIEEGINDGSIVTDFPEELAEFTALTLNLWIGFQLPNFPRQQLLQKFAFLQACFEGLNVPIITDDFFIAINELYDQIENHL